MTARQAMPWMFCICVVLTGLIINDLARRDRVKPRPWWPLVLILTGLCGMLWLAIQLWVSW